MPELMIHCKFSSNWQLSVANYLNIKIIYLLEAMKKKRRNKRRAGSYFLHYKKLASNSSSNEQNSKLAKRYTMQSIFHSVFCFSFQNNY